MSADLSAAQQNGYVIGLDGVSGTQPRREIDDLVANDEDVFNLFILALARLQKDEGKMGYFQIAGIHGLPMQAWNNVRVPGQKQDGGYCTHSSFLFPTWHRPYLAMLEQSLYYAGQEIAGQFQDKKWLQAMKRFRLPFWDWHKPRDEKTTTFPGVPKGTVTSFPYDFRQPLVLQSSHLMVYQPDPNDRRNEKILTPFRNPLLTYNFPQSGGIPSDDWKALDKDDAEQGFELNASRSRTMRRPQAIGRLGDLDDNFEALNGVLNSGREPRVELALDLLQKTSYNKYLNLASAQARRTVPGVDRDGRRVWRLPTGDPSGSLEDLHNFYHGAAGGQGHMARVPVAAFDPIFWLHHCNIDRILSVWQATHKDFLPDDDSKISQSVKLWPFLTGKSKTDFWTSKQCKDPRVFGYTYADIEEPEDQVLSKFVKRYNWSLQSNSMTSPPDSMKPVKVSKARVFQASGGTAPRSGVSSLMAMAPEQQPLIVDDMAADSVNINHSGISLPDLLVAEAAQLVEKESEGSVPIVQWYVDSLVNKDALNGAFDIYYFLGDKATMASADADPNNYATASTMAGFTHVFTAPREACDACAYTTAQSDEGQSTIVTSTNPITPMLRDYIAKGELEGLAPEQVIPFLQKHLYWRVVGINVMPQNPEAVRELQISVTSTVAVFHPDESIPAQWVGHEHPEVTERHVAGNPPDAA